MFLNITPVSVNLQISTVEAHADPEGRDIEDMLTMVDCVVGTSHIALKETSQKSNYGF